MGFPIDGDLVPSTSGFSNLGVDVNANAQNAFDIASISPFNHIHMVSGVFHDPLYGQSGVLRFNQVASEFQVSVDGGLTFNSIASTGSNSGLCYSENFINVTSTTITHNLGTTNVVVDVFDASDNKLFADRVGIVDINNIVIEFNRPQIGKVVIVACGGNDTNLEEAKRYALLIS